MYSKKRGLRLNIYRTRASQSISSRKAAFSYHSHPQSYPHSGDNSVDNGGKKATRDGFSPNYDVFFAYRPWKDQTVVHQIHKVIHNGGVFLPTNNPPWRNPDPATRAATAVPKHPQSGRRPARGSSRSAKTGARQTPSP